MREKICLEFCEVSCGRFGWAGSEAKINFGPGSQAGNLEKTNLEAMPTPPPPPLALQVGTMESLVIWTSYFEMDNEVVRLLSFK